MPPIVNVASSIDEIWNALQFRNPLWKNAHFGQIAFRGQPDYRYKLIPSAFRTGTLPEYIGDRKVTVYHDILRQSRIEYLCALEFVEIADSVGLSLPSEIQSFRDLRELTGTPATNFWKNEWPYPHHMELIALAQHHRVPTRMLDFTYDPQIALYFAATEATRKAGDDDKPEYFSVWALDLRFVRTIENMSRYSSTRERIREVRVSRATNRYLHAQQGFFLLDTRAGQYWSGSSKALDDVMEERVAYWTTKRIGSWGRNPPGNQFFLPSARIDVPIALIDDVREALYQQGTNLATVMPNHDNVVDAIAQMRLMNLDYFSLAGI